MATKTILMFHGIGDPPADIPAEEKPYWISKQFFREILEVTRDRPEVVFTFDDGNISDLDAADQLAAAGLAGKFFVLTGRFGRENYLGPGDLVALEGMDMEVGLHGTHHVDWRKIGDDELEDETVVSRKRIEDAIGKPVRSLAIPFGAYDRRVYRHLERMPIDCIYTSDRGRAPVGARFLRRNPVMAEQSIRDIEDILEDRASLAMRLRRAVMPPVKRFLL